MAKGTTVRMWRRSLIVLIGLIVVGFGVIAVRLVRLQLIDGQFLQEKAIAQQLARALTRFFGLPFIYPMDPVTGTVSLSYGTLNLRSYPSSTGTVIASIPNGASVTVYGEWQGWYVVHYGEYVGYAAAEFIRT